MHDDSRASYTERAWNELLVSNILDFMLLILIILYEKHLKKTAMSYVQKLRVNQTYHDLDFDFANDVLRWLTLWLYWFKWSLMGNHKYNTWSMLNWVEWLSKHIMYSTDRYHSDEGESSVPPSRFRTWQRTRQLALILHIVSYDLVLRNHRGNN